MNDNEQLSETLWYLFEAKLATEKKMCVFQPTLSIFSMEKGASTWLA